MICVSYKDFILMLPTFTISSLKLFAIIHPPLPPPSPLQPRNILFIKTMIVFVLSYYHQRLILRTANGKADEVIFTRSKIA